jgi:hypothetical protein
MTVVLANDKRDIRDALPNIARVGKMGLKLGEAFADREGKVF